MRVFTMIPWSAAFGALVLLPAGFLLDSVPQTLARENPCDSRLETPAVVCADSEPQGSASVPPLLAGDAPAFLMASVQTINAPEAWRAVYHEVERCAGMVGDYDEVRWSVMEAPLRGPRGPTYGFNIGRRIVMVRQDTTYLRHEMLHHILQVAGWQPRPLNDGERYTTADLHPLPLFVACTGGR